MPLARGLTIDPRAGIRGAAREHYREMHIINGNSTGQFASRRAFFSVPRISLLCLALLFLSLPRLLSSRLVLLHPSSACRIRAG